jgi:hypothetical protein
MLYGFIVVEKLRSLEVEVAAAFLTKTLSKSLAAA